MTKINEFTRQTCREIRTALDEALEVLAEEYGLGAKSLNGTFNEDSFTVKVEFAVKRGDLAMTKPVRDFKAYATQSGLNPETDLGRVFKSHVSGEHFKVTGLATKARRYPILAERVSDGKKFKFPVDVVKAGWVE